MQFSWTVVVGQVVSVLAFYSGVPSSIPAKSYIFSVKFVFEKRPGLSNL